MEIDLELYRKEVVVSTGPLVRLSVIDVSPEIPNQTLVFLHGFGGQANQWKHQLRKFSFANRAIAIDLRGHGRSDRPRGSYKMSVILSDIEAVLNALDVNGKIVLLGHSFGGAIAAEYSAIHPERVDRLVLIASAGEFKLNPFIRLSMHLPLPLLKTLITLARARLGAPPHVLKSWFFDNLSKWNGWSLFRNLALPALVIRGHYDLVLQRPLFEEVARAIPDSEEVDVGASGHMVMLERREAVNRAIERFLEASPRSWREADQRSEDASRPVLIQERPWLVKYDEGVPYTIAVPRVPIQQLLRSAVRRFPHRKALEFEGGGLTYRRLNQEANCFANALLGLGVKQGDRVLLLLPNCPQLVIAFFGALKMGAVAVFTFPQTETSELVRQVKDCGATVLVTITRLSAQAETLRTETPIAHVIFTGIEEYLPFYKRLALGLATGRRRISNNGKPRNTASSSGASRVHQMRDLLRCHEFDGPEEEISSNDLAVIQYTGGTTAAPKGVMLSHRNLVANALQTRHWMPNAQEGRERFLCVIPFSHSYGLTAGLTVPICLGATMILKATFQVGDVLRSIRRHRPTIFPGVPQMYVAINDFPRVRRFKVQSIKACISGSAPLPVEVQEAFEKLTRGRLVEGYGLTEASPVTHANPLNGLRKVGSIGIPISSTEAKIVDLIKGKKQVTAGQIGELAVRGPQVMMGYWNDERATRQVLSADGWLLTGDVAQVDNEGYFRIIARKADLWYPNKPGEPAFPRDIEEVLFEVPQVKEAAVVAIAGQPIAFIIAKNERPTAEALIAYCKRRLPPELAPRLVIFVDDFPRTFIGKVLRRELASRFEASRQVKLN
jgi:long-chain acyl-CoA synthetase